MKLIGIGQVLRHRDLATTALYAKVDLVTLRSIAQPWPGQTISTLADATAEYLRLRNRLGHELAEYHRLLPRFVAFLDDAGLETVTVAAGLALQAGVDTAVIALWLGHAVLRSTSIYLHADMTIEQRGLDGTTPLSTTPGRHRPNDQLLAFPESL